MRSTLTAKVSRRTIERMRLLISNARFYEWVNFMSLLPLKQLKCVIEVAIAIYE